TDVEVGVGKQFTHFADQLVDEFISAILRGIERRMSSVNSSRGIWSRLAPDLRVSSEHSAAVPGHVEFRDDADAAIARVQHKIANLCLRVVVAFGPEFVQLG